MINELISITDNAFDAFNAFGFKIIHMNVIGFLPLGENAPELSLVIFLLMFGCFYFMFKLKFFNFRYIKYIFQVTLSKEINSSSNIKDSKESLSSIKALLTSIAGSAGVGNIAGVSVALAKGGPGSAIWMIFAAFLCMPLRFAEVFLGHKFRVKGINEYYQGGPVFYIKECFKKAPVFGRFFVLTYCFLFTFATLGGPNSFQMNQCVSVLSTQISFLKGQEFMISLVMTILIASIIFGGLKRISTILSSFLFVIVGVYFVSSFAVIVIHYKNIIPSIILIFKSAFSFNAFQGGILGTFIISFHRILVSNESGLGTSGIMHASSKNKDSVKEALMSTSNPIINVIFICFISAITFVISGIDDYSGGFLVAVKAFKTVSPWLHFSLVIMIPMMVINVISAWSFYGLRNWHYLTKGKYRNVYLFIYLSAAFFGGIVSNFDRVLNFSDIVNLAIAIPHVLVLIVMSKKVVAALDKYKIENNL